jgi:hypothetical protein
MKRILAITGAMVFAMLLLAPVALAADPMPETGRVVISTQGDITIPAGEQADVVMVVNGTATIEGEVNTIVAVDGAVDLTGARTETIVAVRSPVTVGEGTVVLGDVVQLDSVVRQVGSGEVLGQVTDMRASLIGIGAVLAPALILLWIGFGLATIVAGLLLAGLAGRQVRAAEALISREPVLTFAVGILGLVVIPVVAVLLMITVIGAPLGVGILLGLWPLVAFVGYLVAGIWIGDWVLHRVEPATIRARPFLAAVIGILILQVLALVPVLGIVAMIASLFGFGAVLLLAWRTLRYGAAPQTTIHGAAPAPMAS